LLRSFAASVVYRLGTTAENNHRHPRLDFREGRTTGECRVRNKRPAASCGAQAALGSPLRRRSSLHFLLSPGGSVPPPPGGQGPLPVPAWAALLRRFRNVHARGLPAPSAAGR